MLCLVEAYRVLTRDVMGESVDKTLLVAVALVFGASVSRPRWATTIYSKKGLVVGFAGFGAIFFVDP